ncbi:polysaccharide biosynthesis/export family protein, partial [Staphylococcus aureus]|uniref:polysaccharide biosynthesis/export family protein n=1 Tax=Staphylococcus aureus TaxID=1280 RepID=UPI00211C8B60
MSVSRFLTAGALGAAALSGCAGGGVDRPALPPASYVATKETPGEEYVIGPLDQLQIFVWRNPELSSKVQVRPDGRITTPLVSDMPAVGKTPATLADDMKKALGEYIK